MTYTEVCGSAAATVGLTEYDVVVQPARERFLTAPGVISLTSHNTDARTMAAFLLHFSALSVPITEPVEGWLRRAAERCVAIGLTDVGRALLGHSKAEAGHHEYHVADFRSLVAFWNQRWRPLISAGDIAHTPLTVGGTRYCDIHEANIRGDQPFCQLAIEYEIERLPVVLGPRFIQNCVRLLGTDVLECLTFVTSHVEFDVGHTKFNARWLQHVLAADRQRLTPLAAAGSAALDAFGAHLNACWQLGVKLAERT